MNRKQRKAEETQRWINTYQTAFVARHQWIQEQCLARTINVLAAVLVIVGFSVADRYRKK